MTIYCTFPPRQRTLVQRAIDFARPIVSKPHQIEFDAAIRWDEAAINLLVADQGVWLGRVVEHLRVMATHCEKHADRIVAESALDMLREEISLASPSASSSKDRM